MHCALRKARAESSRIGCGEKILEMDSQPAGHTKSAGRHDHVLVVGQSIQRAVIDSWRELVNHAVVCGTTM